MPDAALRTWANYEFPGCIVGTSINENHPGVQSATVLDISFVGTVTDLTGVEAFQNATQMIVSNNPITVWALPPGLGMLGAADCGLTGSFHVPYLIHTLQISFNAITTLVIDFSSNLSSLYAQHNQISTVVGGEDLGWVDLSHNQLTSLSGIATGPLTTYVNASHNLLTSMPAFSSSNLWILDLSWNQIHERADPRRRLQLRRGPEPQRDPVGGHHRRCARVQPEPQPAHAGHRPAEHPAAGAEGERYAAPLPAPS